MDDILLYILAGFVAQLIDGALGMAYGVTASSILMSFGLPPTTVSATVHTAECFSTGASAISHRAFGNIDKQLFKRLLIPAVIGAISGAYILTTIPGDVIKPYIAIYLLAMGVIIVIKAFKEFPPKNITTHLTPLGFGGAFIDAIGGGGWGPIVATNLIARGNDVRTAIGSTNAVEFFVTLAASFVFLITLGLSNVDIILGLAFGGVVAAPLGAWTCKKLPLKPLMIAVGIIVIVLSGYNFYKSIL